MRDRGALPILRPLYPPEGRQEVLAQSGVCLRIAETFFTAAILRSTTQHLVQSTPHGSNLQGNDRGFEPMGRAGASPPAVRGEAAGFSSICPLARRFD